MMLARYIALSFLILMASPRRCPFIKPWASKRESRREIYNSFHAKSRKVRERQSDSGCQELTSFYELRKNLIYWICECQSL